MYEKETLKVKICRHSIIKFGIDFKLMNTPQGFLLHHWNVLARATMSDPASQLLLQSLLQLSLVLVWVISFLNVQSIASLLVLTMISTSLVNPLFRFIPSWTLTRLVILVLANSLGNLPSVFGSNLISWNFINQCNVLWLNLLRRGLTWA